MYYSYIPRLTRILRHCFPDKNGPTVPCLRRDVGRSGIPEIYNIKYIQMLNQLTFQKCAIRHSSAPVRNNIKNSFKNYKSIYNRFHVKILLKNI